MPHVVRVLVPLALFMAGFVTGMLIRPAIAHAQPKVSTQDTSAREAFLKGGDRSVAALNDIKSVLEEQTGLLQQIAANTGKRGN